MQYIDDGTAQSLMLFREAPRKWIFLLRENCKKDYFDILFSCYTQYSVKLVKLCDTNIYELDGDHAFSTFDSYAGLDINIYELDGDHAFSTFDSYAGLDINIYELDSDHAFSTFDSYAGLDINKYELDGDHAFSTFDSYAGLDINIY